MKRERLNRYAFALILLLASLVSLTPARADQAQPQPGAVVLHLTGQATAMNTTVGSLGSAVLHLVGGGLGDGQGGLMIQNLTGDLQIGFLNYSIFAGDGKTDTLGNFMMLGESSSGELVLQGIVQHNSTVTTDATLSRLSSFAYLALSGSMTLTDMGSESVVSGELNQNVASTLENMTSVSPTVNSTSLTQYEFSSSVANFTSQTQITTENTTLSTSNSTSFGQAAPSATLPQQNNTTMTPQLNNHTVTVYVSNAVANSTITQTTTTTVAYTTVTQVISITVSNATVILTNSTNSGH